MGAGSSRKDRRSPIDRDEDGFDDVSAHHPGNPPGRADAAPISACDGGVTRRLTVRCRIAGSVLLVAGATALLVAVLRSWDLVSAVLTILAAGAVTGAVILAVRARMWARIGASPMSAAAGVPATIGRPRPLSPGRPGAPLRRRLGASVVPVRAASDPQPGGGALVVHARTPTGEEAIALAEADAVRIWPVGGTGLGSPRPPSGRSTRATRGRFVIHRQSDGAVFLATTRLTDTW